MSRTQFYTATSLDGFIADRRNSLDWLFQFGGGEGDADMPSDYPAFIAAVGAIAMGSTTYQWLLDNHIAKGRRWDYAQPTWVFTTRRLTPVPGADIRFVKGDVRPVHAEMTRAAEGRNIWLMGGGELVGRFHDHGLLDELIVFVASVTLGAGSPLLPREIVTPPLKLMSVSKIGSAFARLHYEVQR